MRIVLRYLRRALAVILLIAALAFFALLVITRTPAFNRFIRDKLVAYANENYRGHISIGSIEGSVWGELRLDQVALDYKGKRIAYIRRLLVGYSLVPLLWQTVHVKIMADSPWLDAMREPDGKWNLLEAMSGRAPSMPSRRAMTIIVDSAQIQAGALELTAASNGPTYRITSLDLDSQVTVPPSGMIVNLRRLAATVHAPGVPALYVAAALEYDALNFPASLHVADLELRTQTSNIAIAGNLRLARTPAINATISLRPLAAADVTQFYSASPLKADLAGSITIRGLENALHSRLQLAGGGAVISGTADVDATQKMPPFSVKMSLSNANIQHLVRISSADGIFDILLEAQGAGSNVAALKAKIRAQGHNLAAEQYDLGTMDLSAALARRNLDAAMIIAAPAGSLTASGKAAITASPAYHIDIAARRLNAARAGVKGVGSTDLNFRAVIDGRGVRPALASTKVNLSIKRSRLGPVRLDRGILQARISNNRAYIERVHVVAEQSTLDAHGFTGLAADAPLSCSYAFHSGNIKSLLALWKISGGGRLDVSGSAMGRRSKLRTVGQLAADSLLEAGNSIRHVRGRYDLSLSGAGAPFGSVDVSMSGVKAGAELSTVAIAFDAAPGIPRRGALRVNVRDNAGRYDQLAGDFIYRPELLSGRITQLSLELPNGKWRLGRPATFNQSSAGVSISSLRLQNGLSELLLMGSLARRGPQNFTAQVRQVNLSMLALLVPRWHGLHGILSSDLQISGTAAAPAINLTVHANDLRFERQPVGQFNVTANYLQDRAGVNAILRQNAQNSLTVSGSLPMTLSWANGVKANFENGVDLTVHSARLDLNQFGTFFPDDVRDFHGSAAVNLHLQGALTHPQPTGSFSLAGIRGEVIPLGVTVSDMHAQIALRPNEINVETLEARAGHGTLVGRGSIGLSEYTPAALGLTLSFDKWPAINTQEYAAMIGGTLAATGTLHQPQVNGRIEVLNGTIQPDLSFLAATSNLTPDNTITVIAPGQQEMPYQINPKELPPPAPAEPSTFNRLALKIAVVINRNTWIRHPDAAAELEGRLDVDKTAGGPIRVAGEIRTVRGWLNYQNRQFTLQTGVLTFTGGKTIDPNLDIDAQYLVTNYTIDIIVGGTARKPTLKLQSQPQLAQSDILSLLLFGKTTDALAQNQQASLQQTATQMATGLAASQIGQAVATSLGLQSLGIELNGVSSTGGALGFGHYLGRNTYVSASSSLGSSSTPGSSGQKISVQYFILRWLSVTTSTASDGSHEIDLKIVKQY